MSSARQQSMDEWLSQLKGWIPNTEPAKARLIFTLQKWHHHFTLTPSAENSTRCDTINVLLRDLEATIH